MLFPRLLTAIIGLPFLVAAIYFGGTPFFFLVLGIVLIGLREFYFLAGENGYPSYPWLGLLAGSGIVCTVFLNGTSWGQVTDNQTTSSFIALLLTALVLRGLWKGIPDTAMAEWGVTLWGVFYVGWSLSHLLLLRDLRPAGQILTFFLFVLIWVEDISAYWIGTRFGRHPIAPLISSKKTFEGTAAGVIGALGVAVVFQSTLLRQVMRLPEALGLGAVTALLAFASDLGESLLKRGAGVKDSSPLLPGHGGVLDRFDAFVLTAPFFYYYWAFTRH